MVGSIKYVGVVILFEHLNLEDDPLALHHSLTIFGYLARNMRVSACPAKPIGWALGLLSLHLH